MADTKYTYSISVDFPNQKVAPSKLTQEINDSSISSALLLYINTNDDDCDIWFDGVLSGADETTLDGLVAAHDGVDLDVPCCIPTMSSDPENHYEGDMWWNTTSKHLKIYDGTGDRVIVDVFGNDYESASSSGESSTSSSSFQDKLSHTTASLTGTYRVGWHSVVRAGTADTTGEVRLYNSTDTAVVGALQAYFPSSTTERIQVGGFAEVVFSGSAKTFKVQWRDQAGGNTQYIEDARIELWRVS